MAIVLILHLDIKYFVTHATEQSKGYQNWKEEAEAVIIQLGSCLTRSGSSGPDPPD